MGTSTEDAGQQKLPPKPSGVTKPSRPPPTLGKVRKLLKRCLEKKSYAPLPSVINLLNSDGFVGDATVFDLLETCVLKTGNGNFIAAVKAAREKALGPANATKQVLSEGASQPPDQNDQDGTDAQPGQVEKQDEAEQGREAEDPIDWVSKLEALLTDPTGAYELLVSRFRSRPRWFAEADNFCNVLRVRLQITLDVSQNMRRRFGDHITGLGVYHYGPTDDTQEGSDVYNRAAKSAAKECFLTLEKFADQLIKNAAQSIETTLAEYISAWRGADFDRACKRAYYRAKELVINDMHAGLYGARVFMYGSGSTGLALGSSDVDIAILLPGKPDAINASKNEPQVRVKLEVLSLLRRCALKAKMETVCLIDSAKIPVLRYWDPEVKVDVDITLSTENPLLLSRLIRRHMQSDVRVWELCVCIKYWAKQRKVSGVFPEGFINSIGWTIMVIFFLQHVASPRVGSLFRIKGRKSKHCTIMNVPWANNCLPDSPAQQTTSALLTQFFHYFGHEFNFKDYAIALNYQTIDDAKEARIDRNSPVFIEHPLVRGTNVVGHVTTNSLERTLKEMRKGYFECLTAGDAEVLFKERLGDTSDREKFFID